MIEASSFNGENPPRRETYKLRHALQISIDDISSQYRNLIDTYDVNGLKWLEALNIIELLAGNTYEGSLALFAQDFLIAASTKDAERSDLSKAHAIVTREALKLLTQAIDNEIDQINNTEALVRFTQALPSTVLWGDRGGIISLSRNTRLAYLILKNSCFLDHMTDRADKTREQVVSMLRRFRREIGYNAGIEREDRYGTASGKYLHLQQRLDGEINESPDDPDDYTA